MKVLVAAIAAGCCIGLAACGGGGTHADTQPTSAATTASESPTQADTDWLDSMGRNSIGLLLGDLSTIAGSGNATNVRAACTEMLGYVGEARKLPEPPTDVAVRDWRDALSSLALAGAGCSNLTNPTQTANYLSEGFSAISRLKDDLDAGR